MYTSVKVKCIMFFLILVQLAAVKVHFTNVCLLQVTVSSRRTRRTRLQARCGVAVASRVGLKYVCTATACRQIYIVDSASCCLMAITQELARRTTMTKRRSVKLYSFFQLTNKLSEEFWWWMVGYLLLRL